MTRRSPEKIADEIVEAFDWPDTFGIMHLKMHIVKAIREEREPIFVNEASEVKYWKDKYIEARQSGFAEGMEIANQWMRDYDKLKAKYEPLVGVTSGDK